MASRQIAVLYDGSFFTFKWLKALLWAGDEMRREGIKVSFIDPAQYLPFKFGRTALPAIMRKRKFDVVFVAHHHSLGTGFGSLKPAQLHPLLEQLRSQSNMLVWLDTADSSGTCRFDVLPYVDIYLKKQVLTDRERYLTKIWGGRVFCQYYHDNFGVEDEELSAMQYLPLDPDAASKIRLSWNIGLSDVFQENKYLSYLLPRRNSLPDFELPDSTRSFDTHYRGTAWASVAGWQRAKTQELLQKRTDVTYPDVGSKVSYQQYIEEIRTSRSVISPFGWGEICFRDFEAQAFGATLLKPSMEHLDTFPNWYRDGETYVPIDWDFHNFDSILDNVLSEPNRHREIARNAQSLYRSFLEGKDGKKAFTNHLISTLGWN